MKNEKAFKFQIPFITAAVALVVIIPLRVYQYFSLIDSSTGFYNRINFSVYIIAAMSAIVILTSIIYAVIARKSMPVMQDRLGKVPYTIIYMLTAISFVIDCVMEIEKYMNVCSSYDISSSTQSYSEYLATKGTTLMILQAVFAILTAVYFFILALSKVALKGKITNSFLLKLLALTPVIWAVVRILYRFMSKISFLNVSDLTLELFMLVFLMMFLLAFSQVNSEIAADTVYWKIFAYGIPAAVLCLVSFIPKFILIVTGNSSMIYEEYSAYPCDLMLAVMIVSTLFSRIKTKSHN